MSKIKLATLILLIPTLGLVILGCWKKPAANQNQNTNIQTNTNQDIQVIDSDIDTSDWQTYRNEEFGYEVKYPQGWGIKHFNKDEPKEDPIQSLSMVEIRDDADKLVFFVLIDKLPENIFTENLIEYFENNFIGINNLSDWTVDKIEVAGKKTKKYNNGVSRIIIPLEKNQNLIGIYFNLTYKNEDYNINNLIDKILSTFRI